MLNLKNYFEERKHHAGVEKAKRIIDGFNKSGAATAEEVAYVMNLVNEEDNNGIAAYFNVKGVDVALRFEDYALNMSESLEEKEALKKTLKEEYEKMILRTKTTFDGSGDAPVPEEIYPELRRINSYIAEKCQNKSGTLPDILADLEHLSKAIIDVSSFRVINKSNNS